MVNNDPETENSADQAPQNDETDAPKRGNPYEVVQIYDTTCNKIRRARNFKISSFEEATETGEVQMRKSVEFIIVGNNRTWKMYIPFDEFVKANPEVNLPGEPN